jgi:hypothetical protein
MWSRRCARWCWWLAVAVLKRPSADRGAPQTVDPGGTITPVSKQRTLSSSQLVEVSTQLPEVVLKESVNWTNITFKGKGFAWVDHSENRAMIKASHDERDALLATAPAVYEAGWATISSAWVKVRLELADPQEVFELLEEAWRMTATKRAIKAFDEARARQPAPSRAAAWHWRWNNSHDPPDP